MVASDKGNGRVIGHERVEKIFMHFLYMSSFSK